MFSATLFLAGAFAVRASEPGEIPVPALAPASHEPVPLNPQEQALVKQYDANGEGKLGAGEVAAAHEAMQSRLEGRDLIAREIYRQLLVKFDVGHQGYLSADEQAQAVAALAQDWPGIYHIILRRFDRNSDGKLDPAETARLFQYFSSLPTRNETQAPVPPAVGGPPGQRMYERLLAGFDREHKGSLSPDEQAQALAYLEEHAPRVYARLVQLFDENGDGKLDAGETARLFAILARIAGPPPPLSG